MRVYVYPSDLGGCGYYRLTWPANVLKAAGYDVRVIHPSQANKIGGGVDKDGKLVSLKIPSDADVMVFQRVTSRLIIDGIKIMRANGIAVVIDVDDDMHSIHPANPAFNALRPGGDKPEYDWHNAQAALAGATLVTTSTDALLKRYASHGRGVVLHNCIPKIALEIPHVDSESFGWPGALLSHMDDPQVMGTSAARLQREGYEFRIVGPPRGTKAAFQLDQDPTTTGPVPLGAWLHSIAKLGVGVAPLNDTRFNAAKSWLKMLEMAAVGVPCVGSPRNEYRRLHALGVGLLADNPRAWYRHLKSLLTNPTQRAELGQAGREAVKQLTIEGNAWRWAEAWEQALQIERGPLGIRKAAS